MRSLYHLVIKSPAGEKRAQLVGIADGGFLTLSAAMHVNEAGRLDFTLLADNPVIALLEDDSQVELWRNGTMLFRTLYQQPHLYTVDEQDQERFVATCYGEKDLLNRAIIAWPSGTINRSIFTELSAENILNVLVQTNVTSEATVANGRLLDNPMTMITMGVDAGHGTILTRDGLSGKSLLQEMKEVAKLGNVDFDLIKTGSQIWQFQVFDGQRGVDRTDTVVFSRSRRNMASLSLTGSTQDPRTAIVVGGNGEGDAREFVVRYGPDYSKSNHREFFQTFSGEIGGTAMMQAAGDQAAQENRLRNMLDFVPLQVAGTRFGIDYGLGDLVKGTYRDVTAIYQVVGVSLSAEAGNPEEISIELEQR